MHYLEAFLKQLSFVKFQPSDPIPQLSLLHEIVNLRLPPEYANLGKDLAPLRIMRRMSSFPISALIGVIMRHLPPEQIYLNIGVWHGFTLFSGMLLSPQTACIGIDNFSEFGPRDLNHHYFQLFFEEMTSGPHQRFIEMDYRDFFKSHPRVPVGLYFYDGDHDYQHQLQGLELADPWIVTGGIVLVDDTNFSEPRQATLDFLAVHPQYRLLADLPTANNAHPTFWNGLMILIKEDQPSLQSHKPITL